VEFAISGCSWWTSSTASDVEQRDALRSRDGRQGTTPHLLVMTATPIPRTVP